MTTSLNVLTGKWIIAGGIGWVLISLVIHASAQSKTDQLTDTSVASDFASSEHILKNWTSFRGAIANGHAAHANPPMNWSAKEGRNILWKTKVPKHGMSSPIIWENRLFLTGADDSTRQIYCFETDTGKLLWQHDVNGIPGSPHDGLLPDVLDETGFDRIDELIPCQYVEGPDHGKRDDHGLVYDKQLDANGLEGQLQELRDRYYTYIRERYEALLDRFNSSPATNVYMRDRSRDNEP